MLLAAGSGRRFGMPKALVDTGSGPWVRRALEVLQDTDPRVVVVGAAADAVRALLPDDVLAVDNPDHGQGMGSSLRAGLRALELLDHTVDAALVMLVDLPGVTREVIRRVAAAAGAAPTASAVLARAAFHGMPGHPVLIGRSRWPGVIAGAQGDVGARDFLAAHPPVLIECADLGSGVDVDTPGRAAP